MRQSGILNDQELQEHIKSVSERNARGTNVELCMLGAIAGIDTVIVDSIDGNSVNWNVRQNHVHKLLIVPLQCDAIFEGQKLCGSITIWEINTLTPSIFTSLTPVHNILHDKLTLHNLFLHSPSTTIQSVLRER